MNRAPPTLLCFCPFSRSRWSGKVLISWPGFQTTDKMFTSAVTPVVEQKIWPHCEWCSTFIVFGDCHKKEACQRGVGVFHSQMDCSVRIPKVGQCWKCVPVERHTGAIGSPASPNPRLSMKANFDSSLPLGEQRGRVISFWDLGDPLLNISHGLCCPAGKR